MTALLILGFVAGGTPDADAAAALALARAARERHPVVKVEPVKAPKAGNGFNCSASFCGANGGPGCPSCPNGSGQCACGAVRAPAATLPATPAYLLPAAGYSTCPSGGCPGTTGELARVGLFGRRRN